MSRAQRLVPVREQAEQRESDAAGALAAARNTLSAARAQHRELESFREEYAARVGSAPSATGMQVKGAQEFLRRLEEAIALSRANIERCVLESARSERTWRDRRNRRKAIERLIETHRMSEQAAEHRAEQKQNDEFTLQRLARISDP